MKINKQKENISAKDVIYESFMQAPVPMSLTRADDSTYVAINKTALKYMGLKRNNVIGHKPSELGHIAKEKRDSYLEKIRKKGFAKNIPLEVNIKNWGIIHMLFSVYPVNIGKDSFILSFVTDVDENSSVNKKLYNDKFLRITRQDYGFVKGKLKQYKLTPRQREIALLSLAGSSDEEIAEKLRISDYTVKDHMKEIRKVFGIHRRSELFPKLVNMR